MQSPSVVGDGLVGVDIPKLCQQDQAAESLYAAGIDTGWVGLGGAGSVGGLQDTGVVVSRRLV